MMHVQVGCGSAHLGVREMDGSRISYSNQVKRLYKASTVRRSKLRALRWPAE